MRVKPNDPLEQSAPQDPDHYPTVADADSLIQSIVKDPKAFKHAREQLRNIYSWRVRQSRKSGQALFELMVIFREIAYFGRNKLGVQGLLLDYEEQKPIDSPLAKSVNRVWGGDDAKDDEEEDDGQDV